MMRRLALRIDVDTIEGLYHGLPALLRILTDNGFRATLFLPMGPDVPSFTMARIILRRKHIQQMLRLRPAGKKFIPLAMAGLMTAPRFFHRVLPMFRNELVNHELSLHGHDHWRWILNVHRWSVSRIKTDIRRGCDRFYEVFGTQPAGFGAPGWQATVSSLSAVDTFGFRFASDVRGTTPFIPSGYLTPQIPTTLPTLEEVLRKTGGDALRFRRELFHLLENDTNHCYCAHCETEGMRFLPFFRALISHAREHEISICALGDLLSPTPRHGGTVGYRHIPGRFGPVAWQETETGT